MVKAGEPQNGIYCAAWSAKREPPLCKGRWPKSAILAGGVVKARQSPSQTSKIFDSPLYTRGPWDAPAPVR